MLKDVDYFETRLGKLDGFEDAAEYLRGIVRSKEIKAPAPPQPQEPPAPPPPTKEEEPENSKVRDEKPEAQNPGEEKSDEEKSEPRMSDDAKLEEKPEVPVVEERREHKEPEAGVETGKEKGNNGENVIADAGESAEVEL
jgi:hypothetical protein